MPENKSQKANFLVIIVFLFIFFNQCIGIGNAEIVKIGVLAKRGYSICLKKWAPTAKYLSQKIIGRTFKIIPLGFNEIIPYVEKGECDFILANPAFYVELEKRFGINRIATLKNSCFGNGYTKFGGVVFCRSDEKDITNFNDLKGKIYAAPDPNAFASWIAVCREFKHSGIDPYKDFQRIEFVKTMDAVVYAVKNGKVDAGSVRTDILERMSREGKINFADFHVIGAKKKFLKGLKPFPFVCSTKLYPEWPFASTAHVSDKLAEKVALALIEMPEDSFAACAAECKGWTIPLNYQQVHECMMELKLGPYKNLGNLSFKDVVKKYKYLIIMIAALVVVLAIALIIFLFLNQRIKISNAKLISEVKGRRQKEKELLAVQRQLIASEKRLMNVFQASPLGITLISDRKILWHNNNIAQMLGYSPDEFFGKNARILYTSDEEFKRIGKIINELCAEKRTSETETKWVRKDGSQFDCHIRYALLEPEDQNSIVLAIVEDISERRKAEQEKAKLQAQLNQAQKMESIGILAGGVAHDFNNILTAIIGNADLIMMDIDKNSKFYKEVEEIREAGRRAAALTRQLLAFSRREIISPEIINLNKIVTNLKKMLQRLIGEDIELIIECSDSLAHIKADPGQMEQIIMNLAVNARDAMPGGGKIIIETSNVYLDEKYFKNHAVESCTGAYVMLAITDSGIGMDKKIQARIFEPFFTTKKMGRGTGLGLSTVYGIVKQNKGHIWVYSEKGKGTIFKIYIPAIHAEENKNKKEKNILECKASDTTPKTILVAEDDDMLLEMTKKMLERSGYKVVSANNGEDAIKLINTYERSIHLLLTDVVMPGMNGKELAESIKIKIPDIKILYTSGYTANVIANHGVLGDGVNFIQKPFRQEDLINKIRSLLRKSKSD